MTGPIPINPVHVGTTGVVEPPVIGEPFKLIALALQKRQELDLARQELGRRQQEFELHKKIAGTELAGMELKNEQMKQQFKAQQQDIEDADEALRIYTGSLPQLGDQAGIGRVIAGIKSPGVAAHFYSFLHQGLDVAKTQTGIAHEQAQTNLTQAQADAASQSALDDVATRRILASSDLTTDRGQLRAVRRILMEVGPRAAEPISRALNTGTGFDKIVGPNGYLYVGHNGKWRQDQFLGQKPDNALVEATHRNIGLVMDLLDEQSKLIKDLGIGSSKNPSLAAVAEASRVLGISTEGLSNWLRDDPEQLTRMLRTRFSHLYIGLLPHSRSSQQLLENLAESYWAPAGSGTPLLQKAERDRRHLYRILADLRDGKLTDMSRLPGWQAAASAAAAEGTQVPPTQPGAPPPNPDDWVRPQ